MATEDITVQHSASAETAYFDTQNRVLVLPVWQDMDDAMYDMLVGHEVSHALHTPAEGWQEFVGSGPCSRMRHMFLNVVEDARIERMIKAQFPGLRRDFASAYASLNDRDLFEVAGKDVSGFALIDRLNLHFKLGLFGLLDVPFSSDEQQYVTRMAETTTFDEVMDLASDLYDLEKQNQQQQEQEEAPGSESGTPGEDGDADGEGMETAGEGESDNDSEESSGSGSSTGDEGGDSGQSMTDDTDDGESAESAEGEISSGSGESSDLEWDDYENNVNAAGQTQNAFEQGVSQMRDESAGSYQYSTLPVPNMDKIVVDFSIISEMFTDIDTSHAAAESKTYLNSIKGIVNGMVQRFMMKQAADADKRTSVAKTGVLDPVSMINYRWSEDIFLKNETVADGKNHGMVMYLDWSGSMSPIMQDTMEQLLVLVEFCRKVNIPFEVYAFSSNLYSPFEEYTDEYDEWRKNNSQWNSTADTDCRAHDFQLYNWLSSRMNKRQYAAAVQNLWTTVAGCHSYAARTPRCLSLGCTPLNEAIVCALDQVPAFQQQHGVQIVSTVFLTDGEGHSMVGRYCYGNDKSFVTDKKTKKSYEIPTRGRGGETDALLDMLRDRTGTNLVGVRLHDAKNIKHLRWTIDDDALYEKLSKQYKTENFVTIDSSYDEYFIVKGALKVETDALQELDEDASFTKIKNAFVKGGNRKKASRVIANRMVDIFAA